MGRLARPLRTARRDIRGARSSPSCRRRRVGIRARSLRPDSCGGHRRVVPHRRRVRRTGGGLDRRLLRRRPHRLRHGYRGRRRHCDVRRRARCEHCGPAVVVRVPARALRGSRRRRRRRGQRRPADARDRQLVALRAPRLVGCRHCGEHPHLAVLRLGGDGPAGRRLSESRARPPTRDGACVRRDHRAVRSTGGCDDRDRRERLARSARRPDRRRVRPRRPRRDRGAGRRTDDGNDERLHRSRGQARRSACGRACTARVVCRRCLAQHPAAAAFVLVYVLALASALRLLTGRLRAAALVALALVCVVAVFSAGFLVVPAAAALLVLAVRSGDTDGWARRRPLARARRSRSSSSPSWRS